MDLAPRDLFGGAMRARVPSTFVDASKFRQVPDHQEVYVSKEADASLIIELFDSESFPDDPRNLAESHFALLMEDNSSIDYVLTQKSQNICAGLQLIPKFGESIHCVFVMVGIHRVPPPHNTDIVISLSIRLPPDLVSQCTNPTNGLMAVSLQSDFQAAFKQHTDLFMEIYSSHSIEDYSLFKME